MSFYVTAKNYGYVNKRRRWIINVYNVYFSKMLSLFGQYEVKYSDGSLAYIVEGKPSLTKRMDIYNSKHKEVGSICRVVFSFLPEFKIWMSGKEVGDIKKDFSLFTPKYSISFNNWKVTGDLPGWNFEVYGKGQRIGKVDQKLWHLISHFAIHYENQDNALEMLLLTLAIEAVKESKKAQNQQNSNN